MRRSIRVAVVSSCALAAGLLVAASGRGTDAVGPAPPGPPVVAVGQDGAFAAAVPAFAAGPAISGDSVSWVVEDAARERLFAVAAASADGSLRSLYDAPARRPGSARALDASRTRVVAFRSRPNHIQHCVVGGECSPPAGELIAGPPGGALTRFAGATERLSPSGSCRRRIAQLDGGDVSVSGERIAYARRVRCMSPRRPGRPQVVVRNLRTGAVRVVGRRAADRVQLAGRFVAFDAPRSAPRIVVLDLRSGRRSYRASMAAVAHDSSSYWYSLGRDRRTAARSPRLVRLRRQHARVRAHALSAGRRLGRRRAEADLRRRPHHRPGHGDGDRGPSGARRDPAAGRRAPCRAALSQPLGGAPRVSLPRLAQGPEIAQDRGAGRDQQREARHVSRLPLHRPGRGDEGARRQRDERQRG